METEYIDIDQDEFKKSSRNYSVIAHQRFNRNDTPENPPIRKRVFNPELMDLAGKVMSHDDTGIETGTDSIYIEQQISVNPEQNLIIQESIPLIEESNKSYIDHTSSDEIFEDVSSDEDLKIETQSANTADVEKIIEDGSEAVIRDQKSIDKLPEIQSISSDKVVSYNSAAEIIESETELNANKISKSHADPNIEEECQLSEAAIRINSSLNAEEFHEAEELAQIADEKAEAGVPVDLNDYYLFRKPPYGYTLMKALLENLKRKKSSEIDFSEILCLLQKESSTSSFVIFGQDQVFNVYRILASRGLDKFTSKNLFFSDRDIYLNHNEPYELLKFKGSLVNDFNFKKRFSTDFLTKFSGALFINLNALNFPGWIVFFYRNLDNIDSETLYSRIIKFLPDFIPLFERFRKEQFPKNPFSELNIYDELAFTLNRMSSKATESVNLIYLTVKDYTHELSQDEFQNIWNEHLLSFLSEEDRLIMQGPDRWIILTKLLRTDDVIEHAKILSGRFHGTIKSRNVIYPDSGINVLNYIFTGPENAA